MTEVSRKQIERPRFLPGLGRPKGLHPETNRLGTTTWYYREGHGQRVPMKDARGEWLEFGSNAFCDLYKTLRFGKPGVAPVKASLDRKDEASLGWLIGKFRASKEWPVKKATEASYNTVLRRVEEKNGAEPFRTITARTIASTRDEIAKTAPAVANRFVSVMSVIGKWAASQEVRLIDANWAAGVTKVATTTVHHEMWTPDDREQFCAHWQSGSKERLAYALLFGTGQRRSDVVRMGPKSLTKDREVMMLTQVKTDKEVGIPMSHEWMDLNAEIAAARVVGSETFLVGPRGNPMSADDFGKWFSNAAAEAGLKGHTAHGLRRAASARAVEEGYTAGQLQGVFGYTLQQAEDYIKEFSRETVARGLIRRKVA
jgi:integrase